MRFWFPNPVAQAVALLDACDGNLADARALADLEFDCAGTQRELKWWWNVVFNLTPADESCRLH
jgi:hypothetical protein